MSAPFQDDERREDSLRYAPKWARTTPPGPMNLSEISAAVADGKPAVLDSDVDAPPPLPAREDAQTPRVLRKSAEAHRSVSPPRTGNTSESFEGDAAVKKLRMRQSIEPQMLPEPPISEQRAGLTMIIRLSAAIGVAAAAALAVVYVLPIQRGAEPGVRAPAVTAAAQPEKKPQPSARLVVEDRRGSAGQALPLGVHLVGMAGTSEVYMSGLAVGTRVSAGAAVGPTGWRVSASSLDGATITPPQGFVGAMEVAVDLHDADDRVMDSSLVRLEWASPARPEPQPAVASASVPAPAPPAVQALAPVVAPAPATEPQATPRTPVAPAVAAAPPARPAQPKPTPAQPRPQLSAEEIAMLLSRSDEFLAAGDISTARVLLRRAAETGHARAALALATTYDPVALKQLGLVGVMPDVALALSWYEKAAEFGSTDAAKRAELLATQATTGPAR